MWKVRDSSVRIAYKQIMEMFCFMFYMWLKSKGVVQYLLLNFVLHVQLNFKIRNSMHSSKL